MQELDRIWSMLRERNTVVPTIESLFDSDPERGPRHTRQLGELRIDFSRHPLDDQSWSLLLQLAESRDLTQGIERLLAGDKVNISEGRAALHTALRSPSIAGRTGVSADIEAARARMYDFARALRSGTWQGATGESITDVVNIGIGGSDLGPRLVVQAMSGGDGPRLHFLSNIDGAAVHQITQSLNPATTLFCITSKSFGTRETLTNARTAAAWLGESLGLEQSQLAAHFVAVSANVQRAAEFGIAPDRVLPMWDWVGGRYSLWSAVGFPIAVALGPDRFDQLLQGAELVDVHFGSTELTDNIPVLMGLLGIWHRNVAGIPGYCVVPYDERLTRLPNYLQQLDMESLGKSVDVSGQPLAQPSGTLCWGGTGTDGQHAFFQWLHQGTDPMPVEFIAARTPDHPHQEHHRQLLANLFGQATALMQGRSLEQTRAKLLDDGKSPQQAELLAPHSTFPGNRPSTIIMLERLTASALGSLLALYEHRVFVQSWVWNLNAYDQWGVELGKTLANRVEDQMQGDRSQPTEPSLTHWLDYVESGA